MSEATGIQEEPLMTDCVNSIISTFLPNLKPNHKFRRFDNRKISEMRIARIPGASNASVTLRPGGNPAAQRWALNIAGQPILKTYGRRFKKPSIIQRDGLAVLNIAPFVHLFSTTSHRASSKTCLPVGHELPREHTG